MIRPSGLCAGDPDRQVPGRIGVKLRLRVFVNGVLVGCPDKQTPGRLEYPMRFIVGDRVRSLDDFNDNGADAARMGDYGTVEHVDNDATDGTQYGITVRFDRTGRALTVSPDDLRASFVHTDRLRSFLAEGGVLVRAEGDRTDGTPDLGVAFGPVILWEHGEDRAPDSDRIVYEDGPMGETEFGTVFYVVPAEDVPDRFR